LNYAFADGPKPFTRSYNYENGRLNPTFKLIAPFPANYAGYKTVDKSLLVLGNNEYILTAVGSQLGYLRFTIE